MGGGELGEGGGDSGGAVSELVDSTDIQTTVGKCKLEAELLAFQTTGAQNWKQCVGIS